MSDLIFATKISSTGQAVGVPVRVVRDVADVGEASLVLIDFDDDGLDIAAAIATVRGADPPPRVVAFGSHVSTDRIQAARRAGADEVLPRSVFVQRLAELISTD